MIFTHRQKFIHIFHYFSIIAPKKTPLTAFAMIGVLLSAFVQVQYESMPYEEPLLLSEH